MSSHNEEESESSDYTYNTPQETEEGSTCSNGLNEVEDVTDIYHLEIEDAVAGYENEPRIRHNVCPDSDSDDESTNAPFVRVRRTHQIQKRCGGALYLGKCYSSGVAFKENVLDFALSTGYNIKQYRWDQLKLGYICGTKECPWRVYCSVNKRKNKWKIKRLIEPHSCTPNGAYEMLTNPIIARLFVDKIREEPDYFKPKKIQALIREQYKGISVTRNQCQEARKKAIRWVKQEYDDQFAHIRGYREEILRSNPGSTVEVVTTVGGGAEGEDIFGRFYVCFAALKESWKRNCRGLIRVDGTFLRGTTKGMLLVAQGRDADNCIYPIAWAIVQVEDELSWVWFVKKLQADLELKDGSGFIIMSDRQKGLINAVHKELPNACVHVYGVILYIKADPYEYVADWFLTSHWRDTYENAHNPLRGPESWMRGDIALVCEDPKRQKKNTKEKRKKSANESPSKKKQKKNTSSMELVSATDAQAKQKRSMHCSSCGGAGHNKRSCSRRKKGTDGECSTQPLSQVHDA